MLSERLHRALKAANKSQADLARACGVKPPSVSGWMSGKSKFLRGENLLKAAAFLGVNASWLAEGLGPMQIEEAEAELPFFPEGRRVIALDADDPLPDGVVLIKESRVRFSGGDGHIVPHYEEIEESLPASYRRAWFTAEGMNPAHVRRFQVKGESMERTLFDGDTVLVHMKETAVRDGMVYAFRYGDELRIKRLYKRLSGGLEIRSDNAAFSSEEISAELANEHISIIGRVREKAGKGGL